MEVAERRREKVERLARVGQKEARQELEALERVLESLNQGIPLRRVAGEVEGLAGRTKEWGFLTDRPVLYVLNLGEEQIPGQAELLTEVQERFRTWTACFSPWALRWRRKSWTWTRPNGSVSGKRWSGALPGSNAWSRKAIGSWT